jgi:hypothetical protein
MTVFGDLARPWVLAYGVDQESDLANVLKQLAPVLKFLESPNADSEVRQSDYDAIIIAGDVTTLDRRLNILQFGGSPPRDDFLVREGEMACTYRLYISRDGRAGQLEVPSDLPAEVASLVQQSLAPWLMTISPRPLLKKFIQSRTSGAERLPLPQIIRPFVTERGGDACAGRWSRPPESGQEVAEHWWLPADCPDQPAWLKAAFTEWHRLDSERFPGLPDWLSDPLWMTNAELEAVQELTAVEEELRSSTAALTATRDLLRQRLADVRDAANQTERRLLTAQGEELKSETHSTLTELGFQVIDSDQARAAEGSRLLEDLEVRDGPEWVAIAEVRGYGRGAKTSDFQRLARAARSFERRTGREPDARWYVVNHNLTKAPGDRRPVLAGSEPDVAEFQIDGGCVIDTRDLFRLRELVKSTKLSAERARQLLRECRGVFIHPEPVNDA